MSAILRQIILFFPEWRWKIQSEIKVRVRSQQQNEIERKLRQIRCASLPSRLLCHALCYNVNTIICVNNILSTEMFVKNALL